MNKLKQKSLKLNVILNIIKQLCAVLFPMITFPYVSRALGVEAYGRLNFGISIVGYVSLVAGLGVHSYAVRNGSQLRDDKKHFEKFANEVFSINLLSTLIAYVLLIFVLFFSKSLYSYKALMLVLSVNILLSTLGTDWVNTVYEDFLYLTIRYIICQSLAVVLTFFLVQSPEDLVLYAFLSNIGTISANLMNMYYIRKCLNVKIRFTIKMNLRKHIKPILILFGNMLSSMIYLYSDSSILGIMQNDVAVGVYTVASKIYSIIKQLLNAIAVAAIPRFSYYVTSNRKKELNNNFNELLGMLLLLLLPAVAGLASVGRQIIVVISGVEYEAAYTALSILSISLICSTVACMYVSVVMLALGMEKKILLSTTLSAFVNVVLNLLLIPKFSYNAAAFTTLISEFIMMLLGIYFTRNYLCLQIKKQLLLAIVGMFWVFLACSCVDRLVSGDIISLLISITVSVFGYGIVLLLVFRKEIFARLKER